MTAAYEDLRVMGEETTVDPTSPENQAKAMKTVAAFAEDAEEFRRFMAMLDIPIPVRPRKVRRPGDGDVVSNLKARRHVEWLMHEHGALPARIAKAAGVSHQTVGELLNNPKSYRSTVRALLAVTPESCAKGPNQRRDSREDPTAKLVSSIRTAEHARALRKSMTARQIAQRSGVSADSVRAILRGARQVVTTTTETAILAIPVPEEAA